MEPHCWPHMIFNEKLCQTYCSRQNYSSIFTSLVYKWLSFENVSLYILTFTLTFSPSYLITYFLFAQFA